MAYNSRSRILWPSDLKIWIVTFLAIVVPSFFCVYITIWGCKNFSELDLTARYVLTIIYCVSLFLCLWAFFMVSFTEPGIMPTPADGEEFFNSPDRPVSGLGHPWSIPLRVFRKGDRAVSDVVLGRGFEGAPHMAHGGFVAAIFDDLLGFLLMLEGVMAFTASLTVNFHRGTPIGAPLRFEAWTDRTDGRKLFLAGECRDANGELLTSSEGLFIDARDHFDALVAGEGQVD